MEDDLLGDIDSLPDLPEDFNFDPEDIEEGKRDTKSLNEDISEAKVKRFNENTQLRNNLSLAFTIIIAFWLLSVIIILVGNTQHYKLSDKVLIVLLTTTTINVLGMMMIILHDLFPGEKDKP